MGLATTIAAGFALAAAASADPDASPERKLGGPCAYVEHPGTCTILSVEKTPDSIAQASLVGGPGYEGLAVTFTYAGTDAAGGDVLVQQATEARHELRLMNSWFPGPRFLERYGIAAGKSFECSLKVITQGTCTPTVIDFPLSIALIISNLSLISGNLLPTSQPFGKPPTRLKNEHEVGRRLVQVRQEVSTSRSTGRSIRPAAFQLEHANVLTKSGSNTMKRFVPFSLLSGALLLCLSAGAGQAAVSGSGLTLSHPTAVVQAHWRHHRCWWRNHHHHCRWW